MANVVKNNRTLNMKLAFEDGDDRAISVENPNVSGGLTVLGEQVDALGAYAAANNLFLGDQTGAACRGIKEAVVRNEQVTYLDLT